MGRGKDGSYDSVVLEFSLAPSDESTYTRFHFQMIWMGKEI